MSRRSSKRRTPKRDAARRDVEPPDPLRPEGEPEAAQADRFYAELVGEAPRRSPRARAAVETTGPTPSPPDTAAEGFDDERATTSRRVSRDALVRWAQQMLQQAGTRPGRDDGALGGQTLAALRRFQQQRGLRPDPRLLGDTLHALAGVGGTLPAGVWPGAPPTHQGRSPDLSTPCPGAPTILDRFVFGSAEPTAAHRRAVDALARTIVASWSTDAPVHSACLEGHTDPVGTLAANERLGQRRAEAIQDELVAAIERARSDLSLRVGMWSTSAGETEPLVPNTSDDNRARNRRVEVRLNAAWKGGPPPAPPPPGPGVVPSPPVMAKTVGYVGTIESETRSVARLWFSLTSKPSGTDWVKIGAHRAWFTMSMETKDRPSEMAKLTLLMEAMRSGLQVQVSHGGAAAFHKRSAGDSFECHGVRILRQGLKF